MNRNELNSILKLHKLWKNADPKGRRADLRSADLRSADLRSANLGSADLGNADLRSANLEGADLQSADLQSADLRSADLRSANLQFADLWSADLRSAFFNKETLFPKGFDPVARRMKLVEEEEKEPQAPSPNKQEEAKTVAPKTLHEELSAVLAKHGLILGKTVTLNINFIG